MRNGSEVKSEKDSESVSYLARGCSEYSSKMMDSSNRNSSLVVVFSFKACQVGERME